MTYEELKQWISTAKIVDYDKVDHDDGNEYCDVIYLKDGVLYRISHLNDIPIPDWPHHKEGYSIAEVVKKIRIIEEIYYEGVNEGIK